MIDRKHDLPIIQQAEVLNGKHPVSTAVTPAAGVLLRAYATNA
jgi:hypothetical protein